MLKPRQEPFLINILNPFKNARVMLNNFEIHARKTTEQLLYN